MTEVVIGVLEMSSRSTIGRRDAYCRVVSGVSAAMHTVCDIDPDDPKNMSVLVAVEWIQAAPQSV